MREQPPGDATYDVTVLGAGMAGMCAAARAAQNGARVLVVDTAPTIGGSANLSHGNVWTMSSPDLLATEDPGPYRRHAAEVVGGYVDTTDWLATFGAVLTERKVYRRRQMQRFDVPLTLLRMAQVVTAVGGTILLESSASQIDPTEGGFRLLVETTSGRQLVHSNAVILATGGRQANPDTRRELAPNTPAPLRGNTHSTGGGIAMGRWLGAAVNFDNRGFYGHLVPIGAPALCGLDYLALTLYHSRDSVLLDRTGRRFTDESRGDASNAIALAARGGTGLLLWSESVQQAAVRDPAPVDLAMDRWRYALDRGAEVARARTPVDAPSLARSWGFDQLPALDQRETVLRLGDGPVYMAHVTPAITFTYGGVEADGTGAVLDRNGEPISGLFVAGADLSDIYHQGYCGGLSAAAVTGTRAGTEATRRSHPPRARQPVLRIGR